MSLVKFNTESFIASFEPGLSSFVVQQFKNKLALKLNEVVEEVYKELEKEIPEQIKTKISMFFDDYRDERNVRVEVDLTSFSRGE